MSNNLINLSRLLDGEGLKYFLKSIISKADELFPSISKGNQYDSLIYITYDIDDESSYYGKLNHQILYSRKTYTEQEKSDMFKIYTIDNDVYKYDRPFAKFIAPVTGSYKFTVKGAGCGGSEATAEGSGSGGGEGGMISFTATLTKNDVANIWIGLGSIGNKATFSKVSINNAVNKMIVTSDGGSGMDGGKCYLNGAFINFSNGENGNPGIVKEGAYILPNQTYDFGKGGGKLASRPVGETTTERWINYTLVDNYNDILNIEDYQKIYETFKFEQSIESTASSGCGGGGGLLGWDEKNGKEIYYKGSHGANGYILIEYCAYGSNVQSDVDANVIKAEAAAARAEQYASDMNSKIEGFELELENYIENGDSVLVECGEASTWSE